VDYQMPPTFIPKKTASAEAASASHSKRSVFFYASMGIFVVSLLAALGVFAYQKVLAARVQKMNDDLVAARAAFEPEFIKELQQMDMRIETARLLLARHTSISSVFTLLEKETLSTVRFTKFSIVEPTSKDEFKIELDGEAASFNAVSLQSDVFSKETAFQKPVFSDFDIDKTGIVHFKFSANIAPEFAKYRTHIASGNKSGEKEISPQTASPAAAEIPKDETKPASTTPTKTPAPGKKTPDSGGFGEGEIIF
jgi:hypothetical protein